MANSKQSLAHAMKQHLAWQAAEGTRVILQRRAVPGSAGLRPASKNPTLADVRQALGDCQRCKLCTGRTQIVFGAGDPQAKLMFVGEAPGAEEDRQGEPFVGAAGKLLDKMIVAMKLTRDQVYICNVVKCRPPGNRNPEADEIASCEPFLVSQIRAVRPQVIVALGKVATQALLKENTPISKLRGRWREYQGVALMPTFHPAYLLRNPGEKRTVWEDLKSAIAKMESLR